MGHFVKLEKSWRRWGFFKMDEIFVRPVTSSPSHLILEKIISFLFVHGVTDFSISWSKSEAESAMWKWSTLRDQYALMSACSAARKMESTLVTDCIID